MSARGSRPGRKPLEWPHPRSRPAATLAAQQRANVIQHAVSQIEDHLERTPAQPSIAFLLKYSSIATIFAEPTPAYVQKFKAPPKPASVVQSIAAVEEEKPMTLEETLALLKGD